MTPQRKARELPWCTRQRLQFSCWAHSSSETPGRERTAPKRQLLTDHIREPVTCADPSVVYRRLCAVTCANRAVSADGPERLRVDERAHGGGVGPCRRL